MAARHELFYDTDTALRLVDDEVRAMTGEARAADVVPRGSGLAALPCVLERANEEIQAVLSSLRGGRVALEALEALGAATGDSAQLEDVTTPLAHAAGVLADAEGRLLAVAKLFGSGVTTCDAGRRRAHADEAFPGER